MAGVIGTELVRFDIYGKTQVIANKMESEGTEGRICISEDTKQLLEKLDNLNLIFEPHGLIEVAALNQKIQAYLIKGD